MRHAPAAWAHQSLQNAAATRRRRPASGPPSWTFTGSTFLRSDGASGSYADAATSALARAVFPGTGAPVFTISMWMQTTAVGAVNWLPLDVSDDGTPRLRLTAYDDGSSSFAFALIDGGGSQSSSGDNFLDWSSWAHVALVSDGALLSLYSDGVLVEAVDISTLGPFAAVDAFTLFADYAHANNLAADLRSLAVFGRALSSGEVAALSAAGTGLDLLTVSGAYNGTTGGPEHWYPADGDTGTTVTDRGSVGDCNINLHGGVTIEVDP